MSEPNELKNIAERMQRDIHTGSPDRPPYPRPDLTTPVQMSSSRETSFAAEFVENFFGCVFVIAVGGLLLTALGLLVKVLWDEAQADPVFKMWLGIVITAVCILAIGVIVYTMFTRRKRR